MAARTWVLGVRKLPVTVHDGEPAFVVWMEEDRVLCFEQLEGDEPSDDDLRVTYDRAVEDPEIGEPGQRPKKIRVENGAMAKRVRTLFRGIEVVIGGTPELDGFVAAVVESTLADRREGLALYGETPDALRPELRALAAELEDSAPWDVVPAVPLTLRIPSLGLTDGRVAVMGEDGSAFGLMVFLRAEDEELLLTSGEEPNASIPRCLAAKLLELPNDDGTFFDALVPKAFDRGDTERCSDRELEMVIAATRALCEFAELHHADLADLEKVALGIERTSAVRVGDHTLEVTLRAQEAAA